MWKDIDINTLIPELPNWNNGAGIAVDTWISCIGSYQHLLGYASLLWPEFIAHDECTFLSTGFDEKNYREWLRHFKGDRSAVEAMINHRHIADIFVQEEDRLTVSMELAVGRLLQETWAAKLRQDFPNKKFTVSLPEGDPTDLISYEISFFENR